VVVELRYLKKRGTSRPVRNREMRIRKMGGLGLGLICGIGKFNLGKTAISARIRNDYAFAQQHRPGGMGRM